MSGLKILTTALNKESAPNLSSETLEGWALAMSGLDLSICQIKQRAWLLIQGLVHGLLFTVRLSE
jgi:hypothetical protein